MARQSKQWEILVLKERKEAWVRDTNLKVSINGDDTTLKVTNVSCVTQAG